MEICISNKKILSLAQSVRVVYVHPHTEASDLNLGAHIVPPRLVNFFLSQGGWGVPFNKIKQFITTYEELGVILRKYRVQFVMRTRNLGGLGVHPHPQPT